MPRPRYHGPEIEIYGDRQEIAEQRCFLRQRAYDFLLYLLHAGWDASWMDPYSRTTSAYVYAKRSGDRHAVKVRFADHDGYADVEWYPRVRNATLLRHVEGIGRKA